MKCFNKKLKPIILAIFLTSLIIIGVQPTINSPSQTNEISTGAPVNIQTSASPSSKEHQIVPVSLLVYTQYADKNRELPNTMEALRNSYGTDFYHENLTDYTKLNTELPGHDILLIPEQEQASISTTKTIGSAWASTLTNFVNDGGIIILMDFDALTAATLQIYNESGLMNINGVSDVTSSTINLVNQSDALARGISSSWTAPDWTLSFDTTETTSVVDDGSDPVVVHKIMGYGHIVLIGCDFYDIEVNFQNILGNAIRLHRHVIFDASHTQSETIFNLFSDYADDLVSEGFAVSSMSSFNPAYINSGDVFIVTRAGTTYTAGEVDVIETFVKKGGGLFVATDYIQWGDEIDPLINRFGFIREPTLALEDTDDLLNGNDQLIEYDNIINHSLTLGVSTIELYYHTGFTTIPSSADVIIATDTDVTSRWSDLSPADGIPVVATLITEGNGRVVAFSDGSFMWDAPQNVDGDAEVNYLDDDNEVLLVNSIRWLSAAGVEECVVLFDESKGPVFYLSNWYDTFGHYLTSNGYTLKWMSTFQETLIDNADILVICDGSIDYTASEINIITNFVATGGGLFLLGEHLTFCLQVNPIANKFGIEFNETAGYLLDSDDGLVDGSVIKYKDANIGTHPITQNISSIETSRNSGFVTIGGGSALITTDTDGTCTWSSTGANANGVVIMAATQYKSGRVVVLTDTNFVSTNYDGDGDGDTTFFDSDNERLTVNSFQWLSEAELDNLPPNITIYSPINGTSYGSTAPNFEVEIIEQTPDSLKGLIHVDTMWYSLNGTADFTFTMNGTINQTAWNALPDGPITIRFFANDTLGNLGYRDVNITKFIPPPAPLGDDDDDDDDGKKGAPIPWLLIAAIIGGIIALLAIVLIIKKLRK